MVFVAFHCLQTKFAILWCKCN